MKLTKKNARQHREILRRIKAGIPLAGLLTGMAVLTGCDELKPVGTEPRTVGKEPAPVKLAGDEPAPVQCPAPAPGDGARESVPPPRTTGLPVPPRPPRPLAGEPVVAPKKAPAGK